MKLAAVSEGVGVVHIFVNGLGERTGNTALEELILGPHVLFGYAKRYRLDKICNLVELVGSISQMPIARNKPIIGRRNFTRESGIRVDQVVKEALAMFALDPRVLVRTDDVVLGKKTASCPCSTFWKSWV